ncbi:MAG: hypothetical protein RLN74_01495, partial [Ilumatobacter fluminis]
SVDRFNQSFYLSDPADYLRTRLQLLALAGGRHDEVEALFRNGVEYAGLNFAASDQSDEVDDETDAVVAARARQHQAFLTVESQMILHHAAETVLRLFIVHSQPRRVPWITLNSQRSPRVFKETIRAEFVDRQPDPRLVGSVCLGHATCPGDAASEDDWAEGVEGLTLFLSTFARTILDDAPLYNGIKHGLGVTPSDAVLKIGPVTAGFGTSVEFPESHEWDEEGRDWALTTRWVDIQESVSLAWVAIEMIDSIWQIGRYRAIGQLPKRSGYFPGSLRPWDLRSNSGGSTTRMSWRILREYREPIEKASVERLADQE